jgi:hypothetical protein
MPRTRTEYDVLTLAQKINEVGATLEDEVKFSDLYRSPQGEIHPLPADLFLDWFTHLRALEKQDRTLLNRAIRSTLRGLNNAELTLGVVRSKSVEDLQELRNMSRRSAILINYGFRSNNEPYQLAPEDLQHPLQAHPAVEAILRHSEQFLPSEKRYGPRLIEISGSILVQGYYAADDAKKATMIPLGIVGPDGRSWVMFIPLSDPKS